MTDIDILADKVLAAERLATPGPWDWNVNLKCKLMSLEGNPRKGNETVLAITRWGMSSAKFLFRDNECLLVDADTLVKPLPGRDHHASWRQTIDHPDANLIITMREAARPLAEAVKERGAEIERLKKARSAMSYRIFPNGLGYARRCADCYRTNKGKDDEKFGTYCHRCGGANELT